MPSLTYITVFLTFCIAFSVCKDPVDPCFWPYVNDYSDNYKTPSSWKTNCTNVCGQFPDYMACLDETCNLGSLKMEARETFRTAAVARLTKDCNITCSAFNSTFPAHCGTEFKVNISFFVGVGVVGFLLLLTVFYFVIAKVRGR